MNATASIRYPQNIREQELTNKVAADWFGSFDCTRIIGNIDFCVDLPATELALGYDAEPMLWAEAKAGSKKDIIASFVQLILTIGGEHTADKNLPPHFLGAFDAEKIAFLPYNAVLDILGKNDFDWTVTPSDHESKEFKELYGLAKGVIERQKLLFRYAEDEAALRRFIKANFKSGRRDISKILINKNNFTHIYRQWRETVMPFINAPWDIFKKSNNISDREFFLAEMNIDDNGTPDIDDDRVANDFHITFDAKSSTPYTVKRKNEYDFFESSSFGFKPGGLDAYAAFWRRYKRPPKKEYWDFIVKRIDLLVPQDVRERKGSFFTPAIWVEKSQEYLAAALGENWQDECFIWDCCAGTGNLLNGLTNKYNIWASTLDQPDVDVMKQQVKDGYNLLESHIFKFDFLNDPFTKLPQGLQDIINDPEKRKKLVIYINPPYAEVSSKIATSALPKGKRGVNESIVHSKYAVCLGTAGRELFAQFLIRIAKEIPNCIIGQFSKLKHLQGSAFEQFRRNFKGELLKCFLSPADTFDNVKGKFPIGFFVWRLGYTPPPLRGTSPVSGEESCAPNSPFVSGEELGVPNSPSMIEGVARSAGGVCQGIFTSTVADVYDHKGEFIDTKLLETHSKSDYINAWISQFRQKETDAIGYMDGINGNDFQHNSIVYIIRSKSLLPNPRGIWITRNNLIQVSVYLSVRHCIEATWLNDRDQFLFPNDGWQDDAKFQGDCLVFTLFHGQNRIMSRDGVNHWIPFTEAEVGAKDCFTSHFMSDFLKGMKRTTGTEGTATVCETLLLSHLSPEAQAVMDAGRELWRYYHAQPDANSNASYYDIRLHFQGVKRTASGKEQMNATSSDAKYNELLAALRAAHKALAAQIAPKVYEYGFLKR